MTTETSKIAGIISQIDIPASFLDQTLNQFFEQEAVARAVAYRAHDAAFLKTLTAVCASGATLATLATLLETEADYQEARNILLGKDMALVPREPVYYALITFLLNAECALLPRGHVAWGRRDEFVKATALTTFAN